MSVAADIVAWGLGQIIAGFITDPRKIVEFPITIMEMCMEFASKIGKLVV